METTTTRWEVLAWIALVGLGVSVVAALGFTDRAINQEYVRSAERSAEAPIGQGSAEMPPKQEVYLVACVKVDNGYGEIWWHVKYLLNGVPLSVDTATEDEARKIVAYLKSRYPIQEMP